MNPQLHSQLDKILALADSAHDGEAVVAVRKARQVLSNNGLNFSDLARAASHRPRSISLPFFHADTVALEMENTMLRQQVSSLKADVQMMTNEIHALRQKNSDLEHRSSTSQSEAKRWRQMARDTVEKLYDLGQSIREDDPLMETIKAKRA